MYAYNHQAKTSILRHVQIVEGKERVAATGSSQSAAMDRVIRQCTKEAWSKSSLEAIYSFRCIYSEDAAKEPPLLELIKATCNETRKLNLSPIHHHAVMQAKQKSKGGQAKHGSTLHHAGASERDRYLSDELNDLLKSIKFTWKATRGAGFCKEWRQHVLPNPAWPCWVVCAILDKHEVSRYGTTQCVKSFLVKSTVGHRLLRNAATELLAIRNKQVAINHISQKYTQRYCTWLQICIINANHCMRGLLTASSSRACQGGKFASIANTRSFSQTGGLGFLM